MEVRSTRWEVDEQRRAVRRQLQGRASRQAPGGSARDSETQCSFLTKYLEPYRAKADQAGDRPTARWEGS